jgi:hypothetical protein
MIAPIGDWITKFPGNRPKLIPAWRFRSTSRINNKLTVTPDTQIKRNQPVTHIVLIISMYFFAKFLSDHPFRILCKYIAYISLSDGPFGTPRSRKNQFTTGGTGKRNPMTLKSETWLSPKPICPLRKSKCSLHQRRPEMYLTTIRAG